MCVSIINGEISNHTIQEKEPPKNKEKDSTVISAVILSDKELSERVKETALQTGMRRFCFQLSEEVPPNWQNTVPLILKTLKEFV